jgi:hypothetical protein
MMMKRKKRREYFLRGKLAKWMPLGSEITTMKTS